MTSSTTKKLKIAAAWFNFSIQCQFIQAVIEVMGGGALQDGPWPSQNFGWVGHNNWPVCLFSGKLVKLVPPDVRF